MTTQKPAASLLDRILRPLERPDLDNLDDDAQPTFRAYGHRQLRRHRWGGAPSASGRVVRALLSTVLPAERAPLVARAVADGYAPIPGDADDALLQAIVGATLPGGPNDWGTSGRIPIHLWGPAPIYREFASRKGEFDDLRNLLSVYLEGLEGRVADGGYATQIWDFRAAIDERDSREADIAWLDIVLHAGGLSAEARWVVEVVLATLEPLESSPFGCPRALAAFRGPGNAGGTARAWVLAEMEPEAIASLDIGDPQLVVVGDLVDAAWSLDPTRRAALGAKLVPLLEHGARAPLFEARALLALVAPNMLRSALWASARFLSKPGLSAHDVEGLALEHGGEISSAECERIIAATAAQTASHSKRETSFLAERARRRNGEERTGPPLPDCLARHAIVRTTGLPDLRMDLASVAVAIGIETAPLSGSLRATGSDLLYDPPEVPLLAVVATEEDHAPSFVGPFKGPEEWLAAAKDRVPPGATELHPSDALGLLVGATSAEIRRAAARAFVVAQVAPSRARTDRGGPGLGPQTVDAIAQESLGTDPVFHDLASVLALSSDGFRRWVEIAIPRVEDPLIPARTWAGAIQGLSWNLDVDRRFSRGRLSPGLFRESPWLDFLHAVLRRAQRDPFDDYTIEVEVGAFELIVHAADRLDASEVRLARQVVLDCERHPDEARNHGSETRTVLLELLALGVDTKHALAAIGKEPP